MAHLIVAPVYLAVASGVFLGAQFCASLILSSPVDQTMAAMIGTFFVLTAAVRLVRLLDA